MCCVNSSSPLGPVASSCRSQGLVSCSIWGKPGQGAPLSLAPGAASAQLLDDSGAGGQIRELLAWLNFWLVLLAEYLVDLHEGLALGLGKDETDVDGSDEAHAGEDDEAVRAEGELRGAWVCGERGTVSARAIAPCPCLAP